jgi:hypothetical protein
MSQSDSRLRVQSGDQTAQIKVLDGAANVVARGIGRLEEPLAPGLYKIRVRVGPEVEERIVTHDGHLPVQQFQKFRIPSPIPIDHTSRSHEYHQRAIEKAWAQPATVGYGAMLLIAAREFSLDDSRGHSDPAGSLHLLSPSISLPLTAFATVRTAGDAFAVGAVEVDPGFYEVELRLADGACQRRALHASRGWTTQLYMLFHDRDGERVPNLARGSIAISKAPVVHDAETRLTEIALDALTQHRTIMDRELQNVLMMDFQQPMLGLIGAHLLLRQGDRPELFRSVVGRLSNMLGSDHPDVAALRTAAPLAAKRAEAAVLAFDPEPPVGREDSAGWDVGLSDSS